MHSKLKQTRSPAKRVNQPPLSQTVPPVIPMLPSRYEHYCSILGHNWLCNEICSVCIIHVHAESLLQISFYFSTSHSATISSKKPSEHSGSYLQKLCADMVTWQWRHIFSATVGLVTKGRAIRRERPVCASHPLHLALNPSALVTSRWKSLAACCSWQDVQVCRSHSKLYMFHHDWPAG